MSSSNAVDGGATPARSSCQPRGVSAWHRPFVRGTRRALIKSRKFFFTTAVLGALGGLVVTLAEPRAGSAMPVVVSPLAAELRLPLWSEHFTGPLDWSDPEHHSPSALARTYSLRQEGGVSFLHARHDATQASPPGAMHYGKSFASAPIALERVRLFRWRWRAVVQPAVKDDPWQDMAAGIYVVMKEPSLFSKGRGFKLGWLEKTGPINTYQRGFLQVPMQSDPPSDQWHGEEINLCAAYRRAFGPCEGERILYIGVANDADGTKSIAEGDYADFEIFSLPDTCFCDREVLDSLKHRPHYLTASMVQVGQKYCGSVERRLRPLWLGGRALESSADLSFLGAGQVARAQNESNSRRQ